ncbi:MAG: DUF5103 domain-containing protein [Candidatus Symbiothrix sp.]|nr:DUF5103 domain-containing protein [Candidatus Symbiothrix sp.]
MNTKKLLFILLLASALSTIDAQVYRTKTFTDRIQTLRVNFADKWDAAPVIRLNSGEQVEIKFDLINPSPEYCSYRILHCNADWTPSQLLESEYLDGLQNYPLEDYANSFNTKTEYVNYRLLIPNENVRLKVSGNYVAQVFSEGDDRPLLNVCFSVLEPQTAVSMQISPLTDKGSNSHYQAVSFEIAYNNEIRSPMQELKVFVQQNNRFDNEARLVKPLSLQNRKAIYDHHPALIFNAGNEYRRFEMTTTYYAGLNIDAVEFFAPFYHSTLYPDRKRSDRAYMYYEDQNGRVYIRNNDTDNPDTEADYQVVHFFMPCEKPYAEDVYILSDCFNNILDSRSRMEYSADEKAYTKSVLLKEGYYNYLYVTQAKAGEPAVTAPIEGDYYQTENEYRIWVYACPLGSRYDKLVGVQTLSSR